MCGSAGTALFFTVVVAVVVIVVAVAIVIDVAVNVAVIVDTTCVAINNSIMDVM